MHKQTEQLWQNLWNQYGCKLRIEDGLVNAGKPGHTAEASKVMEAHDGRSTAAYYAVATVLGVPGESERMRILSALAELQLTDDPTSPQYGAFRWYREETRLNDSNAAFFILMPLVVLRLLGGDRIPEDQRALLDLMLERGASWFAHELKQPILYYSNKIVSDGALLLAISKICSLPEHEQTSIDFFNRWLDYTSHRGWGWGENLSLIYIQIIMNALRIAMISLQTSHTELRMKLSSVMDDLIDYVRFHGGCEFVPTIRSYNVEGNLHPKSLMWRISGVDCDPETLSETLSSLDGGVYYWLFEEKLQRAEPAPELPAQRKRLERVMDDRYAHTWIGITGRIGSINRFPVVAGSYQWPTWGLGWQSYPVSLAVLGHQVSYLRWHVHDGEKERTHPASYASAYLGPALFQETWYPDVQLRSVQNDHVVLAVRSMSRLHNEACEIADEWVVPDWNGNTGVALGADGREWTILQYPDSAVLIAPLSGIRYGGQSRQLPQLQKVQDGNTLRLRQLLYTGETQLLQQARLESGWAIYYADGVRGFDEAASLAAGLRIDESSHKDGEVPREAYMEIRNTRLYEFEKQLAWLTLDPHQMESGDM
ncbi:hypothetical protein [Paenibacillus aceris]|uniref:Uncharacterized protein n=1 Tax=Paenibacillus aceris TaxID=869555 RepID=A0ABS4I2E9_9BACL|nr:hypothetical protein [Paenibacillus aceris]MBP1964910.1 hypothetical protein [Paenibacillus aceris]NHW38156.1 hypothetical protein [Paenibacillus aceris]